MRIIVPIILLFFIACNSPEVSKDPISHEPTSIDTAEALNRYNSRNRIAANSEEYIRLEKEGTFIPFSFIRDVDPLPEGIEGGKLDSIYSELTEDSVIIYNYFFVSGSCGKFVIKPDHSKTGVMFWRKTVVEDVKIEDGMFLESGCAMERVFGIRFSLPLKDYPFPAIGYNNQVIPLTNQ